MYLVNNKLLTRVVDSITVSMAGLKDPLNLLLVIYPGPTGVGKTELAKRLS